MEDTSYTPDFFKFLTSDDCNSDEMLLPRKFCNMMSISLNTNWKLAIRNGYKLSVVCDRENRKLIGIRYLFSDFGLTGGELLLFEYVRSNSFKVYIIGKDGNELDYPLIVHASQTCDPVSVWSTDGSWRFVKFVSYADPIVDVVAPPASFLRMFDGKIPERVRYALKDHSLYRGQYDHVERTLSGLRRVCDGLKLDNFNSLDLLVFTYDVDRVFKLSLYDGRNVEIVLDSDVVSSGGLCFQLRYPSHFSIEVMPFHMLLYSHGVDVSAHFFRVTSFWKKNDRITVYKGDLSWQLETKKRREGNRTTINGGWIKFRNDLHLNIGDHCFFKWIDESYHHFRLQIARAVIVID